MKKTWMPTVAGILNIVRAGFKLSAVAVAAIAFLFVGVAPWQPGSSIPQWLAPLLAWFLVTDLIAGVLALVGGICAIKRRAWGWALAGAVAAFYPFSFTGLASVILAAVSRHEFEKEPDATTSSAP